MKTRVIGIAETSKNVWRLTFNGTVLGDSHGYDRARAISEARSFVARNGLDGDWEGSVWVEFRNVLSDECK